MQLLCLNSEVWRQDIEKRKLNNKQDCLKMRACFYIVPSSDRNVLEWRLSSWLICFLHSQSWLETNLAQGWWRHERGLQGQGQNDLRRIYKYMLSDPRPFQSQIGKYYQMMVESNTCYSKIQSCIRLNISKPNRSHIFGSTARLVFLLSKLSSLTVQLLESLATRLFHILALGVTCCRRRCSMIPS